MTQAKEASSAIPPAVFTRASRTLVLIADERKMADLSLSTGVAGHETVMTTAPVFAPLST